MRQAGKRCVLWLGVAALAVYLSLFLHGTRARSTWDAYAAIHEGMTELEVEALLGGPTGDRSTGPANFCIAMTAEESEAFRSELSTKKWINDDALILIGFDWDGRVAQKFCTTNCGPASLSWLDRARLWVGL